MTSDRIKQYISELAPGKVFNISSFDLPRYEMMAAAQTLSRLAKSGEIKRISQGFYYKPKVTPFGEIGVPLDEQMKNLLLDDNRSIGYLTGLTAFNLLSLTTQQPSIIEIGVNYPRRSIKRGIYTVRFLLQKNRITAKNILLLQILDCIKWIKLIPDTNVKRSYSILKRKVDGLTEKELQTMVELAGKYPPSARALLGSMIDPLPISKTLLESLNPLSQYKIGLSLPENLSKWNIL